MSHQHLFSIIKSINDSLITRVIAPSGSGVNLGIPALFQQVSPDSPLTVVCLNDCSAKLWYHQYLLANPESLVGYSTIGESNIKTDTKIHFSTRAYLMRDILSRYAAGELCGAFNHPLYLFETVDEPSGELNVLLALWRYCVQEGDIAARITLVSETSNEIKIPALQGMEGEGKIYRINDQKRDVQVKRNIEVMGLRDDAVYETMTTETINYCDSRQSGSMVVIVPGAAEVELMSIKLKNLDGVLIPVTCDSDMEEIARLIPMNSPKRKVYLVASDCETSLNVTDVSIVIDSFRRVDTNGLRFVTKDEAYRRRGYISHGMSGIWVTMGDIYKLQRYPPRTSKNDSIILQVMAAGIPIQEIFDDESLFEREEIALRFTDEERAFASHFSVDMRLGVLMYRWRNSGLSFFPILLMAAVVDQYGRSGLFQIPRKEKRHTATEHQNRVDEFKAQYYYAYRGNNDVETAMKVVLHLMEETKGLQVETNLVEWCYHHGINHDRLQKILSALDGLVAAVQEKVIFGPFNTGTMMAALRPIVSDIYRDQLLTRTARGYAMPGTKETYQISDRFGYSNMKMNNPNTIAGLVLDRYQMKSGNVIKSVVLAIDLPKTVIKTVGTGSASSGIKKVETNTFNLSNLSSEVQELWKNNKHIHQAIYNSNEFPGGDWQVLRSNRPLEMNDRMISSRSTSSLVYRDKMPGEYRTVEYWSDRRAFVGAIEFLTYYGNRSTTVVWAGARGQFYAKLADLFPHHTFEVYTQDMQPTEHERVHVHTDNFSTVDAEKYFGQKVIFMCDSRRVKTSDSFDVNLDTPSSVHDDMDRQKLWVTIIEPSISWLKFRLPWTSGISTYFPGTMWLQPWGPPTSTETYLVFENVPSTVEYDHDKINNIMYWHNTVQRTVVYDQPEDKFGLDSCYDCSTEQFILRMYNETYQTTVTSGNITSALGDRSL